LKTIRTFKDIVEQAFFDEIENRVSLYIERNFNEMDFQSQKVDSVDEAHAQEQELYRVVAYDTIGDKLSFDAIVVAEVEIYQVNRRMQDLDDTVRKWFRVSCEVDVCNGFDNFKIISIDDEYDHNVNNQNATLDDSLIPIISTADMEQRAEDILSHVYPEALNTPMRLDVERFAERIGLAIVRKRLSRNGAIFGQMIFYPTKVDYYDLDKQSFNTYEAAGGTIFADDEIFFLRNLGSWNNTIIHECVHWLKHRRHIELKRAAGGDVSRISCQVTEAPPDSKQRKRTDTEWMEWHANALAPRVLMPRKPFKQKADELIAWYQLNNGTEKITSILSAVIAELSDFFQVSIQSARIRLLDIGYTEAMGVMEYLDGQYVPPYSFKFDLIGDNQRFTVPMKDGLIQSAVNPDFAAALANGDFVYIDSHYVINASQYVFINDFGILEMTGYARTHMDECCLSFERSTRTNPDYNVNSYTECILYQSATAKTVADYTYKKTDNDKDVIARAVAVRAELEDVKKAAEISAKLPGSFGQSLTMLMEWRGMTVEQLGENARLNNRMIQRMRTDDTKDWDIKKLVALCVGLKLPPPLSMTLLDKAGLKFKSSEEQFICVQILTTRYNSTIQECNELMEIAGFPPLSGKE
jgi:hypothetical protein